MTRKELTSIAGTPYRLDYCEAKSILRHLIQRGEAVKIGYNSGLCGWNWTGYLITTREGARFTVCTGYLPFGREIADRKKLKKAEERERTKRDEKGRIAAKQFLKLLQGC